MVVRYDLTEDFAGAVDITPVPDSHEGRYVSYEDYKELKSELQKYKDQFPDYVECANCGSVTHVEGVE